MNLNRNDRRALIAFVVVAIIAALALVFTANRADGSSPGTSPADPIVVATPADVPEGAVEDDPSTYSTPDSECDVTRSWVHTVPGEEAVYATEYHFAKFTQTRHRHPDSKGFWQVFSPTKPKTFTGPPAHPTDERGKWSAPKYSGGPQPEASGVFQQGGGNGSWFYRHQGSTSTWSEWGPWTKWEPEQHTSWQDSPEPLGTPQPHGSGTEKDGTQWERQWQAQHDGVTRQGDLISEATEGSTTYYAWTDGTTCTTPTPTPTEEPTPTPTETPTVPTPTTPTEVPTTPSTPTEEPSPTPVAPTPTTPSEEPQPEQEQPQPQPVKPSPQPETTGQQVQCVNGTWVTTVNGEVVGRSGTCDRASVTTTAPVEAQEEGL